MLVRSTTALVDGVESLVVVVVAVVVAVVSMTHSGENRRPTRLLPQQRTLRDNDHDKKVRTNDKSVALFACLLPTSVDFGLSDRRPQRAATEERNDYFFISTDSLSTEQPTPTDTRTVNYHRISSIAPMRFARVRASSPLIRPTNPTTDATKLWSGGGGGSKGATGLYNHTDTTQSGGFTKTFCSLDRRLAHAVEAETDRSLFNNFSHSKIQIDPSTAQRDSAGSDGWHRPPADDAFHTHRPQRHRKLLVFFIRASFTLLHCFCADNSLAFTYDGYNRSTKEFDRSAAARKNDHTLAGFLSIVKDRRGRQFPFGTQ
uniref:Uncharacterized protein n=1 Tax=Plectus sambesii TaxID=2011161 RepID=A0A914WR77_9BILA